MLKGLKRWCQKYPGGAMFIILILSIVVVVFGLLGMIAKLKLDIANTNLWETRQTANELKSELSIQEKAYEETIESLEDELAQLQGKVHAENTLAQVESYTPEKVYKFTGVSELRITSNGNPNVRPSPGKNGLTYGNFSGNITLDYFYSTPRLPQEGIGNWIGIPVHLLSEYELGLFPTDISSDLDGVIWVSADYLTFSDWLRNYDATEVNLAVDIATEQSLAG